MKLLRWAFAGLVLSGLTASAGAGEVTVKGVHLCCGACVRDAGDALKGIEGVSQPTANRDSKVVAFKAADDKAAQAGIEALANAGFHGTATHGDKELPFPASGAKKGEKADAVTITGVHLCCGACVTGAQKALDGLEGVTAIDIDRNEETVKLTGKSIDVSAAIDALNKGGFHGTVKK